MTSDVTQRNTQRPPERTSDPLFAALDTDSDGHVSQRTLFATLARMGIERGDPRLRELLVELESARLDELDAQTFARVTHSCERLIANAVRGQMVLPDFPSFTADIDEMFAASRARVDGELPDYIPQLSRVDPEQWGVALCSIDGQRHARGDADTAFCVQSCCKPINYCMVLEEHGRDRVHRHIGREPSGRGFNELTLDHDGRPHNPMINAGAIMGCALLRRGADPATRFDHVMDAWRRLSGGVRAGFNNSVYLSERQTADRNFALGYFMREHGAFPPDTKLVETLEFYFQCCSIEQTARSMSVVAATLANGGVCPLTHERIFETSTVRDCLSLMSSCGMYDFSGEFAFTIGLPAKSGVSGAMMIVIPNVMGLCTWSPRLDRLGNSVRGVEFCTRLVERFNFHNFDTLTGLGSKVDPRNPKHMSDVDGVTALTYACSVDDLTTVRQLLARGVDPSAGDYDRRTPMHLAASEGHRRIVEYLLDHGADPNLRDRWGGTPRGDAERAGHVPTATLLASRGGEV